METLIENIPTEVTEAVTESLRLFRQAKFRKPGEGHEASQPLPSLLERCEQYIAADRQPRKEPVRLVHHFACTGGTLIAKCLACSPNVHVLSEVDPLSTLAPCGGKFTPSDLISLVQSSNRPPSAEEKVDLFLGSLASLYRSNHAKGLRLLIRDHSHSHYCVGPEIPNRPTLAKLLADHYPVSSIVTVRHPIDSWLSLVSNRWLQFQPATVDEYVHRYEAFLDQYPEAPKFRYEDFVQQPDQQLKAMCDALDLVFPEDYRDLFMAHAFSGDSGRSGNRIQSRPRRVIPKETNREIQESAALQTLCRRLNYDL